ncbi:TetR/AcrR family transcriptional regulator [Nocardia sp. NRRL S-836]|uniref:TetR/AcrR family transcriptional regulator n=1 Tax=Nocardia sp. NRRL S-836 TaxID=1519492 RepID=UPI0006ADDDA1|nr:TetR family transcriptional regulator [Nocardia sp. NRRL S-836]KOV87141.1 TetR family transcriptional regulator [Nocardia sp. NRRL S-836]
MTRRGRPPRGMGGLSRAAIVEATLRVLDAEGAAAVGMRSVARVLGVDPKSLYNHVADKDDLLDAVAEHLLAGLVPPERTGDPGHDLRAIADSFRERALRHPGAASLVLTRQLGSLEGLAPVDAVLTVLLDAGAPADEAVHLLRMLLATLIGTLLREVSAAPAFGDPDGSRRSVLAESGLPAVASLAPQLARFDRRAEFDYSVALAVKAVLDRIAAVAHRFGSTSS